MKRLQHADQAVRLQRRRNGIAILISLATVTVLKLNFEPTPAGADASPGKINVAKLSASVGGALPAMPAPVQTASISGEHVGRRDVDYNVEANRLTLLFNLFLLEQGHARLAKAPDYTATFFKHERIGGEMLDPQVMELKLRHAPFSVYMKWHEGEVGRELLYVAGENDGKMIVHPGGLRGRLLPSIKLEPDSNLSMRETRHPVTMVGMLNLAHEIITRRKAEMKANADIRCQLIEDQMINDRPCYCFVLNWVHQHESEEYRKSIQYIDKELSIPVCVKNFAWPDSEEPIPAEKLDEETLTEHYAYTDIQFDKKLTAGDFDRANEEYHFRR
ncbi:MAG: DUF1571 domain-containing protein [Planctomycetaceae bacterium]